MGGRENKKKPHSYSWHPEYGWQLLRRTESYRKAVDVFISMAQKANDKEALAVYSRLSKADFYSIKSNTQVVLSKQRDLSLRQHIFETPSFSFIEDYNFQQDHPLFGHFEPDTLSVKKRKKNELEFDQNSKHYQLFVKWYGDVIRFPISPELLHIDEDVLNSVWVFRPFMIASKDVFSENGDASIEEYKLNPYHYSKQDEKCSYHIIKINRNFSAERIRDEISDYFYKVASNDVYLANKIPWDEDDFELRLKIIDELEEARIKGYKLGAIKLAKKYFAHLKQSDLAKKKKMEKIIKYVQGTMLKIFDRPMPKIKRKKYA